METNFTKYLLGIRGRIISLAVGAATGAAASYFASKGWSINPDLQELVAVASGAAAMWFVDSLVIRSQAEGVKQIQEALPDHVKPDGVPGEITISAVQDAVQSQNQNHQ